MRAAAVRRGVYSSRFHLVVFNVIALVVQDTHCLVAYDGMEWLPGLVVSPVPPPVAWGLCILVSACTS